MQNSMVKVFNERVPKISLHLHRISPQYMKPKMSHEAVIIYLNLNNVNSSNV